MEVATTDGALPADRRWYIAERWQGFEGEASANVFRILAIAGFYGIELINYYGVQLGPLDLPKVQSVTPAFHATITTLCVAWVLGAWVVTICLRQRIFPQSLKYLSVFADVAFTTAILLVSDGPKSPLVVGYFPLVSLAALRFDLNVLRFATAGCVLGYLGLLTQAWLYRPELRVPRYHQMIFLLSLGFCGLFLSHVLRRIRSMAETYAG